MSAKATQTISKKDLTEIKSLSSPPRAVVDTMAAVLVVLGDSVNMAEEWAHAKRAMSKIGKDSLIERMKEFDAATLSPQASKYATEKVLQEYSVEKLLKVNKAVAALYAWLQNAVGTSN